MVLGEIEDKRENVLPSRKRCCSGTSKTSMADSRTVSRITNMERLTLRPAVGLTIIIVLVPICTAAYPTDAADCASRSFSHPSYPAPILCTTVCNDKKNSSDQREFCSRNCPGFYQDCGGEPRQVPLSRTQPSITPSVANNDDLIHPAIQSLPSEPADLNQSAVYNGSAGITSGSNEGSSLVYRYIVPAVIAACSILVIVLIIVVAILLRRKWIKELERGRRPHAQETGRPDTSAARLIA